MTDLCSTRSACISAWSRRKNISRLSRSLKQFLIFCPAMAKSIRMYDSYSFFANCSAIVDLPTRLAPSRSAAYYRGVYRFLQYYILIICRFLQNFICAINRFLQNYWSGRLPGHCSLSRAMLLISL